MKTYTIGFTEKNAETFFGLLKKAGIRTLVDVRIHNTSQLAGFAKRDDLKFFLKALCDAEYVHVPELAPTPALLKAYRQKDLTWQAYEDRFLNLMAKRHVERNVPRSVFEEGCLLCSEHKPHFCHRRLVVEYLNQHWDTQLEVEHLY